MTTKPFDKIIAGIIYDRYILPYSIDYIAEEIEKNHSIPAGVVRKSIYRLEALGVLMINHGHVFVFIEDIEDFIQRA